MATETKKATYIPGMFSWVDVATTDAAAARKFYSNLFGWSALEEPAGSHGSYTMLNLGDRHVGGLYEENEQMRAQGVPPHWMSYVLVEDADKATALAEQLGAKVFVPPVDVMDEGRMAVLQDPTGATFAVWQARKHIGADAVNAPGTMCWHELMTRDVDTAMKFYMQLFGWEHEEKQMGLPTPYHVFSKEGRAVGGMLQMPSQAQGSAAWLVYFAVADCDLTVARVKEMGGKAYVEPQDIPGVGRFAIVSDGPGAAFGVLQPEKR